MQNNLELEKAFFSIEVASENSLIIYWQQKIDPSISQQIQLVNQKIQAEFSAWLIDTVPSYASLLVIYNAVSIDYLSVTKKLETILNNTKNIQLETMDSELLILPVYYSEQTGPDLTRIAQEKSLSVEEVIRIHQQQEYRAYSIGFAPGFCYLGQVDERIAMPRLSSPRKQVAKGAVALADRQTAVYPASSPGGWNILGLCPIDLFNPAADPVMPIKVGDRVKFEAISRNDFLTMGGVL